MKETESDRNDESNSRPKPLFGRWLLLSLLLLLVLLVVFSRRRDSSWALDHPALGKPAPQLDLVRLTDDLSLDSMRSVPDGKVTLVHFWGTWCGPCQAEYPHLSEAVNRLRTDQHFRFVPISCEGRRDESIESLWQKTKRFFASEGIDSVAYADPRGITRMSAAERLGRSSLFFPTSILVDGKGSIAGVWEGYTPEAVHQIETTAGRLLAAGDD